MVRARALAFFGALTTAITVPTAAFAWGDNGHLLITQAAFNRLPNGCLRSFYANNGMALLEASLEPDALRDTDPNEGPRHYLDIDIAGNPAAYPRDLNTSLRLYGAENGTVPWVTASVYQQLVDAFTRRQAANVVTYTGYVSHYASDAHSPYHTTVNYDGQNSGNPGIHGRYEADMIDANFTTVQMQLAMRTMTVAMPADLTGTIHDALQTGWPMNAPINTTDRNARGNITTLWQQHGSAAVDRMAQSAGLIAAMWQAAYAAAGSPMLTGMPAGCSPGPSTDGGVRPDAASDGGSVPPAPDAAPAPAPDADVAAPDAMEPAADGGVAEDAAAVHDDAAQGPAADDAGAASSEDAAVTPSPPGSSGALRDSGCSATGADGLAWAALAAAAMLLLARRRGR